MTIDDDMPWGSLYSVRATITVRGRVYPDSDPIDYTYTMFIQGSVFGDLQSISSSRGG